MALLPPLRPARSTTARRRVALRPAVVALGAMLAVGACNDNDPFRQQASVEVAARTLVVTALTGTAPNARSALLLRMTPSAESPEGVTAGDFHVALDINARGQPVIYPAGLVSQVAARRVGIRRLDAAYDSVLRAPTGGYSSDSSLAVAPGEVVGVQLPGAGAECQFAGRPYFYSKLVVDSVRLSERLLFVRATTNPNCGFRSFAPGIPRD